MPILSAGLPLHARVETRFWRMKEHLQNNEISPEHYLLIQAVVQKSEKAKTWFNVDNPRLAAQP